MYDDYPNDATTTGVLTLDDDATGRMDRLTYEDYFYDADWFSIELEAGQTYQITARTLDPIYLELKMFNGPVSVEHEQDGFLADFAQLTFTAEQTGTYYVQVNNLIGEREGDYRLEADLYEIPESSATHIRLRNYEIRQSEIETAFDRDFFAVDLRQGWTYEVNLRGADTGNGTLADPNLRVYDSSSQLFAGDNNGGAFSNAHLVFEAPDDGTHYLSASGVGAGTGTYEIQFRLLRYVDDAVAGSSTTARVPVLANQTTFVDGSLEVAGDIDWHKVDMVAGRWYQLSGGSFLRDPGGEIVQYIDGYTYFKAEKSGTHHWVVRNPANQPRNYRLLITDNMPAVISATSELVDLTGHETVAFSQLFSLNEFTSDRIQVFSEVDFVAGGGLYPKQRLHTLNADQLADATIYAISRRGEYKVSLRGLEGSTVTGWAHANVRSDQSPSILIGQGNVWDSSNRQRGTENVITYRFADSVPSYFDPGRFTGFAPVSEGVADLFSFIFGYASYPESLTSWMPQLSNYANLSFEYDDSESADIQIFTADSTRAATGYRPGMYGFGDIILSNTEFAGAADEPQAGDERYLQILRAVGSALGIKHWSPQNTRNETIMGSPTGTPLPHSFGYLDVALLREAYGESQLGDPVHWARSDRLGYWPEPFTRTINRQSPANRIDASSADQPVVIDLREGALSYTADRRQTYIIGNDQVVARAIGGEFNDTLTGNHADNRIEGEGGNDFIAGKAGDDRLEGGTGSDIYLYELDGGHDTIIEAGNTREEGGIDTLRITANLGFNSIEDDLTFRRAGNDLLIDLDLNGEYNRYNGTIRVKLMHHGPRQVERLELSNLSAELGSYSLVSIWNAATGRKQRFGGTGQFDEFGQIAAPLG